MHQAIRSARRDKDSLIIGCSRHRLLDERGNIRPANLEDMAVHRIVVVATQVGRDACLMLHVLLPNLLKLLLDIDVDAPVGRRRQAQWPLLSLASRRRWYRCLAAIRRLGRHGAHFLRSMTRAEVLGRRGPCDVNGGLHLGGVGMGLQDIEMFSEPR